MIIDSKGNLFGTTEDGGKGCVIGCGVVFRVDPSGRETVAYSFSGGSDGGHPEAGLIGDAHGNVYGTTVNGGDPACDCGTVFMLDREGNETVLHAFIGGNDGAVPLAGLIRDSMGNLYGTTFYGGPSNNGTVFRVNPSGKETVLYAFKDFEDGWNPFAGVIAVGNALFGTTYGGGIHGGGTVFKLAANGKTILHNFDGINNDGTSPKGLLVYKGALYGTTTSGGGFTCNCGTIYRLDTSGETILHSFTGPDGTNPEAGLVRDEAGNCYGTTLEGGTGFGTIFELDTEGNETVLYSFTGGADGALPRAGLIIDKAGNLYGTTSIFGSHNGGTVFKLTR
ncbi:MAG: hypothetical protein LAO09_22095 [Acidobacteriia bacterium]|nr:hypothetical protein [Terriglobia bacterium]